MKLSIILPLFLCAIPEVLSSSSIRRVLQDDIHDVLINDAKKYVSQVYTKAIADSASMKQQQLSPFEGRRLQYDCSFEEDPLLIPELDDDDYEAICSVTIIDGEVETECDLDLIDSYDPASMCSDRGGSEVAMAHLTASCSNTILNMGFCVADNCNPGYLAEVYNNFFDDIFGPCFRVDLLEEQDPHLSAQCLIDLEEFDDPEEFFPEDPEAEGLCSEALCDFSPIVEDVQTHCTSNGGEAIVTKVVQTCNGDEFVTINVPFCIASSCDPDFFLTFMGATADFEECVTSIYLMDEDEDEDGMATKKSKKGPKEGKAPKSPKAPKEGKAPKSPKAPKEGKAPKGPKGRALL